MKGILAFCYFALSNTVAASGVFGVSYVTYDKYSLKGAAEVGRVRLLPQPTVGDPGGIMRRHAMTCSRLCALNTRCASSIARESNTGSVSCILYSSNLCMNPKLELEPLPGSMARTYDKVPASLISQACNEICMVENPGNCSLCLRPGCTGSQCETCSRTCSDCNKIMYPNSTNEEEVECTLWRGLGNMYQKNIRCLGDKTLLFHRLILQNGTSDAFATFGWDICYDLIDTTQKFLFIELYSENFTFADYAATYSGFYCFKNKSISLGAWVNGSTSDGLSVPILPTDPFVDNATMYHPSCGPFWSRPVNNYQQPVNETAFGLGPCPGLATAFFGTPNVTNGVFTSGIAWATLPDVKFTGVKIYMF